MNVVGPLSMSLASNDSNSLNSQRWTKIFWIRLTVWRSSGGRGQDLSSTVLGRDFLRRMRKLYLMWPIKIWFSSQGGPLRKMKPLMNLKQKIIIVGFTKELHKAIFVQTILWWFGRTGNHWPKEIDKFAQHNVYKKIQTLNIENETISCSTLEWIYLLKVMLSKGSIPIYNIYVKFTFGQNLFHFQSVDKYFLVI